MRRALSNLSLQPSEILFNFLAETVVMRIGSQRFIEINPALAKLPLFDGLTGHPLVGHRLPLMHLDIHRETLR